MGKSHSMNLNGLLAISFTENIAELKSKKLSGNYKKTLSQTLN